MRSPSASERPDRDLSSIGVSVLTLAGVGSVVLGVWLRWLVVEPGHTGSVPRVYISGMEVGIASQDHLVLGLVGIGVITALVLSTRYHRRRLGGVVTMTTGSLLVLLTLWWALETTGTDGVTLDVYVLGTGVYVTVFGGVLLTIAGGIRLVTLGNEHRVEWLRVLDSAVFRR